MHISEIDALAVKHGGVPLHGKERGESVAYAVPAFWFPTLAQADAFENEYPTRRTARASESTRTVEVLDAGHYFYGIYTASNTPPTFGICINRRNGK